jgi:hypothetical protein
MGLFVSIEDAEGERLGGVFEIQRLQRHFPHLSEGKCLPFVSDAEDASFNQAQLPCLVSELEALGATGLKKEEAEELARVVSACAKIRGKKSSSIHFYAAGGSEG